MAKAKLSSSLLAYRDAPPATGLGQHGPASIGMPVDRSIADPFEELKSAFCASNDTVVPVSAQVAAPVKRLGLAVPANEENRRFAPIMRIGLGICGAAAMASLGIVWLMHPAGQSGRPPIALQSNPASPSLSNPAPAAPAPEAAAAVAGASTPATPEPAGSSSQPAAPGAAAASAAVPEPLPTVAAGPVSPQPGPVASGNAPSPAALPVEARLAAEEVAALRTHGDALFGNGDIVSARLFYERAAEGGDAQAALQLGETYDPLFLARARMNGARGDVATATRWYRRAAELGASEAQILLNSPADR
jgi:hypothetical protein